MSRIAEPAIHADAAIHPSTLRQNDPPDVGAERVALPRKTVVAYGIGQVAEGIKNHAFTAFLLFYYTSVLGVSGTLAGAALMIALVFDAVTDPLVAVFSDRTRSRWGRRHPYLYASAIPLALFFYLVFAPPAELGTSLGVDPEYALFGWLVTFAVLTRAAMTLFHVPHMALGAELTTDFDERTRVVTARSFASVLGTTVAVICYFVLVQAYQSPEVPDGRLHPMPYVIFAGAFAVVIALAVLISAYGTRDRIPYLVEPDDLGHAQTVLQALVGDMSEALRLRSFRALFLGFCTCLVGFGVTNALASHSALYFWHLSIEQQGVQGVGMLIGILVGMAYWRGYSERHDKKPAVMIGMVVFTGFAAVPPILKVVGLFPPEASAFYFPLIVLLTVTATFGISAPIVVVGSMMADITDEDALMSRRRREGIFFGALSFASKAASGLGVVVAGVVYDAVGLYQGLDPAAAPPEIETRLGWITGGIILALVSLSLVFLGRYSLSRERHAEIRRALDRAEPSPLAAVPPALR